MDKLAFQSHHASFSKKYPSDALLRGSTPAHIAKQNGQHKTQYSMRLQRVTKLSHELLLQ